MIANLVTVRRQQRPPFDLQPLGTAHVVVDVMGFYAMSSGPAGSRFHSLPSLLRHATPVAVPPEPDPAVRSPAATVCPIRGSLRS
jgi:hypothetical protein